MSFVRQCARLSWPTGQVYLPACTMLNLLAPTHRLLVDLRTDAPSPSRSALCSNTDAYQALPPHCLAIHHDQNPSPRPMRQADSGQ